MTVVYSVLAGVVGERMHRLCRRCRGADEVRIGLALGHVLGSGKAQDRAPVLSGVVADGQQFERGERADNEIDLVALDQFLRLCPGARRVAAGIGNDQFGRPPGKLVAAMLEEQRNPLLHLDAALRERTGLDGQQSDLDRLRLRDRRSEAKARRGCTGGAGGQKAATIELARHFQSSLRPEDEAVRFL